MIFDETTFCMKTITDISIKGILRNQNGSFSLYILEHNMKNTKTNLVQIIFKRKFEQFWFPNGMIS